MLCGLFVETDQYAWSVKTCSEENDNQMGSFFCKTKIPDLPLFDYFYRTRLNPGGQTTRLLHDLMMDVKRCRLAAMYRLVLKAGVPKKDVFLTTPTV